MYDQKQISVIIAEDEPIILNNIAKKVENSACFFKVIQKASDGSEVTALLKKQVPDILITDIEMPGMSGLELIKEVTINYPSVKIIILSGYNNFEYARTAMHYGIKEYLLKPVIQSDLTSVLLKLAEEIWQNRKNMERNILSRTISDVKSNEIPPAFFGGKSFLLSLITLGNLPSKYVQPQYTPFFPALWEKIDFTACINDLASVSRFWLIDEACCLQKFLILHVEPEKLSADYINMALYNCLLPVMGKIPFHIVTADKTISYDEIWSNAKQLREYTNQTTLLYTQDYCLHASEAKSFSQDYKKQKGKIDFLYQLASSGELIKYLTETLYEYTNDDIPQFYIEDFIYQCYRLLPLLFPVEENACRQAEYQILSTLHESPDMDRLCEKITASLSELFSEHSAEVNTDSLHKKIKKYIDNNYHQEITAETLSRRFGYTPSYINRIFKKASGATPLQYVAMLRIERAKELLLQGIDIKKIAVMTGYEDARYFSRVFKNETGLTPSAWAQQTHRHDNAAPARKTDDGERRL